MAASPHLMAAMTALAKSKGGMSNAELGEAVHDSSEWTTLWTVRQLMALGFVKFNVDFFGNPNRYELDGQGRSALSAITGQPTATPAPPSPASPPPQAAVPRPAAPAPTPQPKPVVPASKQV